jgi:hypothetical protein
MRALGFEPKKEEIKKMIQVSTSAQDPIMPAVHGRLLHACAAYNSPRTWHE